MCQGEADVNGSGDDQAGDDRRLVAKSQAEDDVGGSSSLAGLSHILSVTAVVQCKDANTHSVLVMTLQIKFSPVSPAI